MGTPVMTLTGSVKADLSVTATHIFDLATGTVPLRKTPSTTVSSSATMHTMDLIWQDANTIAGGAAAVDIDLAGALENYWGETAVFDRVHIVYVKNTTAGATAGNSVLRVGVDANPFPWFFTTPATDSIDLEAGDWVCSSTGGDAGWPVGAGATDVLQIANTDGVHAATYEIVIIGESTTSAATTTTTAAATTTTAGVTTTT